MGRRPHCVTCLLAPRNTCPTSRQGSPSCGRQLAVILSFRGVRLHLKRPSLTRSPSSRSRTDYELKTQPPQTIINSQPAPCALPSRSLPTFTTRPSIFVALHAPTPFNRKLTAPLEPDQETLKRPRFTAPSAAMRKKGPPERQRFAPSAPQPLTSSPSTQEGLAFAKRLLQRRQEARIAGAFTGPLWARVILTRVPTRLGPWTRNGPIALGKGALVMLIRQKIRPPATRNVVATRSDRS